MQSSPPAQAVSPAKAVLLEAESALNARYEKEVDAGRFRTLQNETLEKLQQAAQLVSDAEPDVAARIDLRLGSLLLEEVRLQEAIERLSRAADYYCKSGSPGTAASALQKLIEGELDRGDYQKAQMTLERLEVEAKRTRGLSACTAMNALGKAYLRMGRFQEAQIALGEARTQAIDRPVQPGLRARMAINLSSVFREIGRSDQAKICLEQCEIALSKEKGKTKGKEQEREGKERESGGSLDDRLYDLAMADVMVNLGHVESLSDRQTAGQILQRAIEILKRHFDETHPSVLEVELMRAEYLPPDEGREVVAGVRGPMVIAWGENHPNIYRFDLQLARMSEAQDCSRTVKLVSHAAEAIFERYRLRSAQTLKALVDAIRISDDCGDVPTRNFLLELFEPAQREMLRDPLLHHLELLPVALTYADYLAKSTRTREEAVKLYRKLIDSFIHTLGHGHIRVADVRLRLGKCQELAGLISDAKATYREASLFLDQEFDDHEIKKQLVSRLESLESRD